MYDALLQWLLGLSLAYVLVVLGLAKWSSQKVSNLADYFLAGRHAGPWLIMMTFVAAWFGAGSTIGTLGGLQKTGLSVLWDLAIPSLSSLALISAVIAPRVVQQPYTTMPEAVLQHYGKAGRVFLACIILVSTTTFMGSQMVAAGHLLFDTFGLPFQQAVFWTGLFVMLYTSLGGFMTVLFTDMLQFIIFNLAMLAMAVAVLVLYGQHPQAAERFAAHIHQHPQSLMMVTDLPTHLALVFTYTLGWSIAPEMWQRLNATNSVITACKATWYATAVLVLLFALITLSGVFSWGILLPDSQTVLGSLCRQLWPPLGAFILLGVLCAITSTLDSSLNVGTMTLTQDIILGWLHPKATPVQQVWLGRWMTLVMILPAGLIALRFQDIFKILWLSGDMFAAAMFIPMMGILFMKSPPRLAGNLAMALGSVSVLITNGLQYVSDPVFQQMFAWWPKPPFSTAFGVSLSVIGFGIGVGYSWLSKPECPEDRLTP